MITADTITDEQIRELLDQARSNFATEGALLRVARESIRSAAHALGYSQVMIEGIDCRMPHGMEADFQRRARARCAEILNAREVQS